MILGIKPSVASLPILILVFLCGAAPAQQTPPALAAELLSAPDDERVAFLLADQDVNDELFQACRDAAQANLDHRQFAAAVRGFSAALLVAKKLGNYTDSATAYRGIGLAYRGMSQTALALSNYELGYESAVAAEDKGLMAALLRGSGVAKRNLGRIDDAIADDEHSLALYRELNNQREEAAGLANLAVNYLKTGDLRRAAQILEEARVMGQAWPEIVDPIISNLGRTAAQQGNFPAAREYLEQTISAEQQKRHTPATTLIALANLGLVYRGMGQLEKAESTLDHALVLARELHDPNIETNVLLNRAEIHESRNRKNLAVADLKAALLILNGIDAPLVKAFVVVPLVRLEGGCSEAGPTPALEEALATGHQFQAHYVLWQAFEVTGECAVARKDYAAAREAFTKSVEEVELLRDLAGGDDQTASPFLSDKTQPYQSLLAVALQQDEPEFALATAERAKARQLLDTVRRGNSKPRTLLTAEELATEQRLSDVLVQLDRQLEKVPAGASRQQVQAQWTKAQMQLAGYRQNLFSQHPALGGERGDGAPAKLAEMAELLTNDQTALVEFTVAEKDLYVFCVTRGADGKATLTARTVKMTRAELAMAVNRFREQLASRSPAYKSAAAELYARLMGPIGTVLQGKNALVIVPDGPLWELPFQALVRPDGAHVIERQTIFYTPSLTYLRESRRARDQAHAPRRLMALGNPGSAGLPNARREVAGLGAIYHAAEVRILTGAAATKKEWMASAPEYRVLHLATHGILNSANPMYSWLSLAPAVAGNADDALEAREVIGMHLHADVAVLSACDTARGQAASGEGMVGMSWAFLMAGAATTVVSQWSVDSESTTELMLGFHARFQKTLENKTGRALALRNAALAVMRSPEHHHPYYWAGFVMVGDGY